MEAILQVPDLHRNPGRHAICNPAISDITDFVSWGYNLDFCIRNNLKAFIAGWTDPEIKAYLGTEFTYTYHAVYKKSGPAFCPGQIQIVF